MKCRFLVLLSIWILGLPSLVAAQTGSTPSLRPYAHVFIAYVIAWLLVGGWIGSIARRLRRIEQRIGESEG